MRDLARLLETLGGEQWGTAGGEASGIAYDSRRVGPGGIFVAIPGFRDDGHRYIPAAVAAGAAAVVAERDPDSLPVPWVRVADSRRALAQLACGFFDHPSRELDLVGVTGTNGKTTTTHLLRQVLEAAGSKTGLLGTVHNLIGDRVLPVEHTTPEAPDLQQLLRRMVDEGCRAAVMEVSSHSLTLQRVAGTHFRVTVLTNVTQDHLDFHGTFEAYLAAKASLFDATRPAALNADDPNFPLFRKRCRRVLTYGLGEGAQVRGEAVRVLPEGARFNLITSRGVWPVRLSLTGRFNVYNALAAAAAALLLGVDETAVVRGLEAARPVTGRLERVEEGQPFTVVVDYAHTPDGLEKLLTTVREFTAGRVLLVFGCGGDRDRGKRPLMGEVAARRADYAWLTADNPRSEDPEAIIEEITVGFRRAGRDNYRRTVDRAMAIREALRAARPGDAVVVAGKGHETYQIFRDRTEAFSDREELRRGLNER
ncbi:MAG: UDP-N-acetylmuramoyl-L-alanyl-D-glutamate--2,6-diaminopimelate ligase [Thermaerobacter sp.]|nr:UDP-N-acetylmuramoyl-L-alanyl-D-glutamate--2,6-diaminopimelate ligase [Thermaerobacter sp.]